MDESSIRAKMQPVLDLIFSDIASVRSGRVSPKLVEDLQVTVYAGAQKLKIKELATITVQDAQTLIIEPWDKSIIGEIRQGILVANIGMNPIVETEQLRISMPPMTSEDRESYVKLLHTKLENGKVMIRQIRGDFMKSIKEAFEDKEISEDEKFAQEKRLQEITDEFVGNIEGLGKKKEEELLQI